MEKREPVNVLNFSVLHGIAPEKGAAISVSTWSSCLVMMNVRKLIVPFQFEDESKILVVDVGFFFV